MKKIEFEFQTKYGIFRDALYVNDDQFSEQELNQIKQQRVDNWISSVESNSDQTLESYSELIEPELIINGDLYRLLQGVPPSGAKLIEVKNNWYYKD